jgi:hypothetical protein
VFLDSKSNCTREELKATVDELIGFDMELAKLFKSKEDRYDFDRLYNLRHLSDLQELAPGVSPLILNRISLFFRLIGPAT